MSDTEQGIKVCADCGASIYPEHLQRHAAEQWEGRLLCPHCLREKKNTADASGADEGPISLTDDEEAPARPKDHRSKIRYSDGTYASARGLEPQLRRPLHHQEVFATRCKTFHCKLSGAAISHLDDQINEWVDAHEDIEIKFATSTVGIVEGKSSDQHLIVTVFY